MRRWEWWFGLVAAIGLAIASQANSSDDHEWWKAAVIYEIYPRSFQDSNGDGIGDLNGITQRLDYLKSLGVDAIWIAPMYPSPQVDFGYDVADYEAVDPQYGSLADLDHLLAEAQKRQIRVILDMVLNHTSDQHPWFVAASSARANSFHDFYVWSDGRTGPNGRHLPPNNWVSMFGGPAWEYVSGVNQYYYHAFYSAQPDLNWRNPAVEKAMFEAMRFWLDRGVAGFRLDAVPALFEDRRLRDEADLKGHPTLEDMRNASHQYTYNLPEVHQVMRRLRAMMAHYPGDRVLIGETDLPTTRSMDAWYGGARHDELQLTMDMLIGFHNKLDAPTFRRLLQEANSQLHGSQPLFVFDNHDNPRSWDRYGDGKHDDQIARLLATLLLTSKAGVLLYQGEEIGQRTVTPTRIEDVKDPIGIVGWPKEKGRDGERTPMQWDTSNAQAGFSTNATTWLPVPENYRAVNVQSELADPQSLLNWYKKLILMRHTLSCLRHGSVVLLGENNSSVLSYARVNRQGESVVVVLNMSAIPQNIALDFSAAGIKGHTVETLLAYPGASGILQTRQNIQVAPFGTWVARIH